QENEKDLIDAVYKDLSRPGHETLLGEIEPTKAEIVEACKELHHWAKARKAKTDWVWALASATITPCPKGVALIIGTWNFPIGLLFGPLVGAISAGCPALLKPAEQNPAVATLIAQLVPKYLDPKSYKVINGAIDETTELLKLKFDHIFYTGSGTVGKIVAKAAAEHLTPVTLELGGKSPALVFDDADVKTIARRIIWGKYLNSGQSALAEFNPIEKGSDVSASLVDSKNYSSIVNKNHFDRISKLMDDTDGRVVIGGKRDATSNKIEITVVADVKTNDALMKVVVESKDEMVQYINDNDNPLALYVFTQKKANRDYIFNNTRSGTFVQNDVVVQFTIPGLPFGGAGASGYGNYHGKASFDTFSHERSAAHVPTWMEVSVVLTSPPNG
ncbi:hypothetical protein P7C70_g5527, partial [Phenoliferia sp. Uapishka_3]